MTIKEIKTAVNNVLIKHGQRVVSNETDEGYDKPAFFVRVIPISHERISPVYEDVELEVELHYEPAIQTDEECMRMADNIDIWFAEPFAVGDRMIKPPEDIQHTTDDDIVLFSSFSIVVTRIFKENGYDGQETLLEEMELNLNISQGGKR